MTRVADIKGQRFGRLVVLERADSRRGEAYWLCGCDCGEPATIRGTNLRSGTTQSCGCLQVERTIAATPKRVATLVARGSKRKPSRLVGDALCWQCPACKRWLPAEGFYSKPQNANGLTSRCRPCHGEQSVRTRNADLVRDTNRAYMRRARAGNICRFREREREASRKRTASIKSRARYLLNAAVRSGKVEKPETCERCGAGGKLHGHHWDYSRPLEVKWLCPPCHGIAHRKTDAGREAAA